MKKKEGIKRLSDMEWTCLWAAMRYFMNRMTIASATFPADVIRNYYNRLSDNQKAMLARDLKDNEEDYYGEAFGSKEIDRPHWIKFWKLLDKHSHYTIKTVDGNIVQVFDADSKVIPINEYIEEPHRDWYIPKDNIKTIIDDNKPDGN